MKKKKKQKEDTPHINIGQMFQSEMQQDSDSDQWGIVFWLGTKNENAARNLANKIIDVWNKAPEGDS